AGSFVEESNLTFNIRQLRVVLGDDAHQPKYIKTVRRHGYRFIADVRRISETHDARENAREELHETPKALFALPVSEFSENIAPTPAANPAPKSAKFLTPLILTAAFLLIAAAFAGSWLFRPDDSAKHAPVLSAPFNNEKLSTNGKVALAVISPDGRNVVYSDGTNTGKESLWLRQLETGGSTEIIPPGEFFYYGLAFAPAGDFLYFVRKPRGGDEKQPDIYRISIFGGVPEKIVSQTQGWISVSPDGARLSFVRCEYREEEFCSLWIADAAGGKNERKLAARPRPFRIRGNEISPDGKRVAFAVGQSENASNGFELREVDLETGAERELTKERFFNIGRIEWLPGELGWLITASRNPNRNSGIWQISADTGEAVVLTKDSEVYNALSLDQKATKIVTTLVKKDFRLRLVDAENQVDKRLLTDAGDAAFAPDGKIYFSSNLSGNSEIWSIKADGTDQRQLTNSPADEGAVAVSPADGAIYFTSNRTGAAQIWRMNPDGTEQTQITQQEGGFPLFASPDGEWVYYQHGLNRTLWRASTKDGVLREQLVLNKAKDYFAVSPDGAFVAYSERRADQKILTVAALADGETVKTFPLPDKNRRLLNIVWLPDGRNLAYVSSNMEYKNNILWRQPLDGGAPQQIAALGDEELTGFGLSIAPDGKTFSVVQGKWLHDAVLFKGLR
ncbi:MAG TPA: DUF5050 domain-containing protein, partial [Pyrinomonadaceae bacterium]